MSTTFLQRFRAAVGDPIRVRHRRYLAGNWAPTTIAVRLNLSAGHVASVYLDVARGDLVNMTSESARRLASALLVAADAVTEYDAGPGDR